MPADHPDTTYYCTQCRIETSLARVCPKCHRKTTLRVEDPRAVSTGGIRRRTSATGASVAPPRPIWLWALGGAMATVTLVAVVWWGIARWRESPVPKKSDRPSRSVGSTAPQGSNRIFGAPRPGKRLAPPGPPRICGTAYQASIQYRFADSSGPGKKPAPPKAKAKGPEAMEHRHTFLLAKTRGHLTYVPLAYEVQITFGGRTVTGLKLDRTGGLVPDRRSRRPRRLGYHDSLQPGLRISDLIGRVQADLERDSRGGLKVTRQRLKNPLISQWLRIGIELTRFLHPHPPKPGARVFEDRRLPPGDLVPGLKNLVRRFRLQPTKKSGSSDVLVSYSTDAPARSMRRAKSSTPVGGQVLLAPAEPLPRKAELRLSKVVRKGGGTQTITLRLSRLGPRCNDK